jgi:serine/threonine-protein kinase
METIGKYKIISELGHGGFGRVYKAEDPSIGMLVAIKVLNEQSDEGMIRRFRAEAVTSAKMRHKNIVTIFDFDVEKGAQYLVMEFLDGQNLQQLLRAPIPPLDRLSILAEVAEGLQYAHEQGVIHRDVKPANIMRLKDGSVKIMDFGIARVTEKSTRETKVGFMVGTPDYMAPEQLETGQAGDVQCDVWAYGVVFYEFLTGTNPFAAESLAAAFFKVTQENPRPICDCVPGLPRSLDTLVARLLAKKKEQRYSSMEEVLLDLGPVIQELGEAQVAVMEEDAERLIAAGRYDDALSVAGRILKYDQRNVKARKWRTELRDLSRRQADEARIRALIEEADAKTTLLDFSAAQLYLKEALQIDPNHALAETRLNTLYAEQENRERAKSLLAEARVDFDRQALTSAFDHAQQAVQTDPLNADAAAFVSQVKQALDSRDAQARRKAILSKARGLVLVQDYAGAVATLQELAAEYPTDSEVLGRLGEALRLQALDVAEKKVAAAIARSREYLVKGAFADAFNLLSGLDPESAANPQVQQLLSFSRDQLEQQRRDAEVERLLGEAAAPKVDSDKALAALARVLELSPGDERALRLRKAVLANRQREEENKAVEAGLQSCRDLIAAGRLEEAQASARAVSKRYPDHSAALEMIRDIAERIRQREERRQAEIDSRRLEVQLLLDGGKLDAAKALLGVLSDRYPREMAFADLQKRIAAMERERREQDEAGSALARSKSLAEAGRWDDARRVVEQALKQFPKSVPLQEERRRQLEQGDLQTLIGDIEQKLSREELDAAITSAESGVRRFPENSRLRDMLGNARGLSELRKLRRRAETQILSGQTEDAQKTLTELARRAPGDAGTERLQQSLDRDRKRRQDLAAVEQFRRKFAFEEARKILAGILRGDPDDAAVKALLEKVDRESADYNRSQKIADARAEAARRSKRKDFAGAVSILSAIADEFPDDTEVQEDLRRVCDLRDQTVRKEAYRLGCREFDGLMRNRQFEQAIAKARDLLAAYPGEADLEDDLRQATEALAQAARQETYTKGRRDLAALLKNRQFDQAIARAEELIAAYPEEPELQDDLRRIREARADAARRQAYAESRREVDALLKNRQFDQAISLMEKLAAAFPDDPGLQEELHRAIESRDELARNEALSRGRREFDALMKSRDLERAVAFAEALVAQFPNEPELSEDLKRAREARGQAARSEAYAAGRKELDALFKNRQFEQAIVRVTALMAAFPDALELQDELNRARQAHDQAVRKEACARGRKQLDDLMKDRQFERAVDAAEKLATSFPEEPEFQEALRRARVGRDQAARKDAYTRGRLELEAKMRVGQFDRAVAAAQQLIATFPDEPELQEDLRRACESRDQAARKANYALGRQQFEELMRNRQFERAVAKAQELLAAFPTEASGPDDLKRAQEAQLQATRKAAYDRGRKEFDVLMRARQFAQAVEKAQELAAAFPEYGLQDEIKRASEARDKVLRKAAYDQQRKEFDDLMKVGQLEKAIGKAEALARDFPDDPVIQQDLQAARAAQKVRARSAEMEAQIAELEVFFRKGDSDTVRKRAEALLRKYDDPRAKELLRWATRSQTDLEALKRATAPSRFKWIFRSGVSLAVIAGGIVAGISITYLLRTRQAPIKLTLNSAQLAFTLEAGGAAASQSLHIGLTGAAPNGSAHWAATANHDWIWVSPDHGVTPADATISVDPRLLSPGANASGYVVISSEDGASSARLNVNVVVHGSKPSPPAESVVVPPAEPKQLPPAKPKTTAPAKPTEGQTGTGKSLPVEPRPNPVVETKADNPAVVTPAPPPPPATGCGPKYRLPKTGMLTWYSGRDPLAGGGVLVFNWYDEHPGGGELHGQLYGCPVEFTNKTVGITIEEAPTAADGFRRVKIRNSSSVPLSKIELQWKKID